jgi:hypothetical protein
MWSPSGDRRQTRRLATHTGGLWGRFARQTRSAAWLSHRGTTTCSAMTRAPRLTLGERCRRPPTEDDLRFFKHLEQEMDAERRAKGLPHAPVKDYVPSSFEPGYPARVPKDDLDWAMRGNQLESFSFHPAGTTNGHLPIRGDAQGGPGRGVGRIASQEDAARESPPEVLERMRREDPTASAAANFGHGSCTVPAVKVVAVLPPGTKRATTMIAAPCRASASLAQVSRRLAFVPRNSRPAAEAPAVRSSAYEPASPGRPPLAAATATTQIHSLP